VMLEYYLLIKKLEVYAKRNYNKHKTEIIGRAGLHSSRCEEVDIYF